MLKSQLIHSRDDAETSGTGLEPVNGAVGGMQVSDGAT